MPNIKQQKKRVRTATRERLQKLPHPPTVKTLTKRLESAVADGEKERATAEHRQLVRAIDKATSRRALHRNTAARKKAQAARLLSGSSPGFPPGGLIAGQGAWPTWRVRPLAGAPGSGRSARG